MTPNLRVILSLLLATAIMTTNFPTHAVTRRTLDGKNSQGWIPEQRISVEEAVRAYTVGSAYAEFQENVKGTIAPGKLADLVILSRDIFKIDPKVIEHTKVVLTVLDGRVVYEDRK